MVRSAAAVVFAVLISASAPQPSLAQSPAKEGFSTAYGVPLSVTTGESIFVEGDYTLRDAAILSSRIRSTMPGSMMIPFAFSIEPGELRFRIASGNFEYFCARPESSSASFPGLGIVVLPEDCVGIRRDKVSGTVEWIVDNSFHNGADRSLTWVWHRRANSSELKTIKFEAKEQVADATLRKTVYFDGYYSGLLNFTYLDGDRKREMKFDYSGSGGKMLGMLGKKLLILGADSVDLKYMWVK